MANHPLHRSAEYLRASAWILATGAAAFTVRGRLDTIDVAMLFLLGIVVAALQYHPGPALLAAGLAIGLFDFVFVPPYYAFDVHDTGYILTFGMMLLLAVTVSRMATRIREQGRVALSLVEAREAAQSLASAEQLRIALLSSLSHDLRTPLATIEGAASTLVGDADTLASSEVRELSESIVSESQRMARLVGNLLDMVRLESGQLAVHGEWQPLEESLGVAVLRTEGLLGARVVDARLPPALPLVLIDGLLIEQVFVNLLENAAKYTPVDATITITAWTDQRAVTVEVADDGPGVPLDEQDAVFGKFYRAAGGAARNEGSGLGLTICRGILSAHGGRIWVERADSGGAAFRFSLPLHPGTPIIPLESAAPQ